jgi:23S rRNA (pseudouridine1915-N3)-methyltransferase
VKIRLLWVGKTRTRFISEGIEHYIKLLRPMVNLNIVELKEARGMAKVAVLDAEAKAILRASKDYILLDERGLEPTSVGFAELLQGYLQSSKTIDFVFGGAFGVSSEVKKNAMATLSLSKMTLPHELSRLVFLEQLYRAFTILKGKEYHY